MPIIFDRGTTQNLAKGTDLEWLETNGIGGWASGTLSGVSTRRYHGVLCAALNPPIGRNLIVSKMSETFQTIEGSFELDSNNFNGIIQPDGYKYLTKYEQDLFPTFFYYFGDTIVKKTVAMVYGENTTIISYQIIETKGEITLKLKPFISAKDYHWMSKANDDIKWAYNFNNGILKLNPYVTIPEISISVPKSEFHYSPDWYYNFMYKIEQERGQDFKEDLFTYGDFSVKLQKGEIINVLVSTENIEGKDGSILLKDQFDRKNKLLRNVPPEDLFLRTLTLAADQFVVGRGKELKTIIAGYHWFSDWGRDTMIALQGLCLVTGRFDDAKKILKAFAEATDQGMIPNRFPDVGEKPEYNTIDATLWYFVAAYEYMKYSKDSLFVKGELYSVLKLIIDWHLKGTRFNIKMQADGLLFGGDQTSQLTWMDAKVGDWVVTPREGKPVEINALWYNALKIMGYFAHEFQLDIDNKMYEKLASHTHKSFNEQFVNEKGTLYDVINGSFKDSSIRPNQLFAISLPFVLVNAKVAKSIIKETELHLLTTRGLRSLSNKDPKYIPYYYGSQLHRDGSYHQGTTWSWLIGPYLTAKYKAEGKASIVKIKKILQQFSEHFYEAGIGQISEIFDGNEPYSPKGCMAQAWGVAELLRVHSEINTIAKN